MRFFSLVSLRDLHSRTGYRDIPALMEAVHRDTGLRGHASCAATHQPHMTVHVSEPESLALAARAAAGTCSREVRAHSRGHCGRLVPKTLGSTQLAEHERSVSSSWWGNRCCGLTSYRFVPGASSCGQLFSTICTLPLKQRVLL